jgi:hypothetical protein
MTPQRAGYFSPEVAVQNEGEKEGRKLDGF